MTIYHSMRLYSKDSGNNKLKRKWSSVNNTVPVWEEFNVERHIKFKENNFGSLQTVNRKTLNSFLIIIIAHQ